MSRDKLPRVFSRILRSWRGDGERFDSLFEHSPDIIVLLDKDGFIRETSSSIEHLLGWKSADVIGRYVLDSVHPDDAGTLTQKLDDLFQHPHETHTAISRVRHKNGTWRYIESMARNHLELPSIRAIVVTSRDVTERKLAEDTLQESEKLYRSLVETSPDGIAVFGLDGTILMGNQRTATLLGYERAEELVGRNSFEFILPEEHERARHELEKNLSAGSILDPGMMFTLIKKDGSWLISDLSTSLITDADGSPKSFIIIVRDATQRRQAEQALRASEEKFRTIVEQSSDGFLLVDEQGILIEWNPAHERITGIPRDAVIGKPFKDALYDMHAPERRSSEFREQLEAVLSETLSTGQSSLLNRPIERNMQFPDGSSKVIQQISFPIKTDKGYRIGSITRDITEIKQAEATLRDNERFMSAIVESAPFGAHFYELHPDDQLVFVGANSAASQILGIDHQPLIGRTIEEAFPGLAEGEIPQAYRRVAAIGERYEKDQIIYDSEGIHGIFEIHAFQTGADRMAVFFRDVTERKRAEEQIRQRNQELMAIGQIINQIAINLNLPTILNLALHSALDLTGAEGGILCLVNQDKQNLELAAAHKISDRLREDLSSGNAQVGVGLAGWVAKTGKSLILRDHASKSKYVAREAGRAEGIRFYGGFPLKVKGQVIGTLSIFSRSDFRPTQHSLGLVRQLCGPIALAIDNAKLYEQTQRYADELERHVQERTAQLEAANRELESFSYSVSHDLRAPLRGMDGFSQALLEDYGDQLDEQARGYLGRIRAASQRMSLLIDDLLKLSRVTRSEMHREPVDLSEIAQSIAANLQATKPERQVTWVIAPHLVVNADTNLLHIALGNLLENAWKFTSKHLTARVEVGALEQNGNVVYYVRDDGAGFDMAFASRLFGAFQRLHNAYEFEGTGVGLATVQRVIHRHGGSVWAESVVEQGTTIYFTLP